MYVKFSPGALAIAFAMGTIVTFFFSIFKFIPQHVEIKIQYLYILKVITYFTN